MRGSQAVAGPVFTNETAEGAEERAGSGNQAEMPLLVVAELGTRYGFSNPSVQVSSQNAIESEGMSCYLFIFNSL